MSGGFPPPDIFRMAGYLCPMPIGILFMLTAPIFNYSSLILHLDAADIIHCCITIQNCWHHITRNLA